MMGGEINWAALPWMAHRLGIEDLDMVCVLLEAIRDRRAELDRTK